MGGKKTCESMLGGQTRCQTHKHQTHDGSEEDERESPTAVHLATTHNADMHSK